MSNAVISGSLMLVIKSNARRFACSRRYTCDHCATSPIKLSACRQSGSKSSRFAAVGAGSDGGAGRKAPGAIASRRRLGRRPGAGCHPMHAEKFRADFFCSAASESKSSSRSCHPDSRPGVETYPRRRSFVRGFVCGARREEVWARPRPALRPRPRCTRLRAEGNRTIAGSPVPSEGSHSGGHPSRPEDPGASRPLCGPAHTAAGGRW